MDKSTQSAQGTGGAGAVAGAVAETTGGPGTDTDTQASGTPTTGHAAPGASGAPGTAGAPGAPVTSAPVSGVPGAPVTSAPVNGVPVTDIPLSGIPVTGEEMPKPPPEVVEAARRAPDHWLVMVDLTWHGAGAPPPWALIGQWRSGPTGEIEEWQDNPEYRPSPQMLDWPEPTDPVDHAVQLAATGYGPMRDVPAALADAQVSVLVDASGAPMSAASPEGAPVVPVYTSDAYLEAVGRLLYDRQPVADLLERLPTGHDLYVNPTGPVSMLVAAEQVRAALAADGSTTGGQADGAADTEAAAARRPGMATVGAEPIGTDGARNAEGVATRAPGTAIGKPARTGAVGAGMAGSGATGGSSG